MRVESLGESSVNIRVMVKTRPGKQWDMGRELRKRIKDAFDAAGIEIPFPQRVIHQVGDGQQPALSSRRKGMDAAIEE